MAGQGGGMELILAAQLDILDWIMRLCVLTTSRIIGKSMPTRNISPSIRVVHRADPRATMVIVTEVEWPDGLLENGSSV
jgi:hypothetical protein